MARWIRSSTLIVAVLVLVSVPARTTAAPLGPVSTLDQANDVVAQGFVGGTQTASQTFTAGRNGVLDRVELKGFRGTESGAFPIQITAVDQNGLPTGPALGSGSADPTSLPEYAGAPNAGVWLSVSISPGVLVTGGVRYAIVRPPGGANPFRWSTSSDSYPAGYASPSLPLQPSYDYLFRTYVLTPQPAVLTCFGETATIYVEDGKIAGGPHDGTTYLGTLSGTNGADVIVGTDGSDTISGRSGNDVICGLAGNDTLSGDNDRDQIDGGAGYDLLTGNNGDDTLVGGPGQDLLLGGNGVDTLTGGAEADAFDGGRGPDTIADYNAGQGDTKVSVP